MSRKIRFEPSSGNVFTDLGLPHPKKLLEQAKMRRNIIKPTPPKQVVNPKRLQRLFDKFERHGNAEEEWAKMLIRAFNQWRKHRDKSNYYFQLIQKEEAK
jgi:hypothetical protein